MAKKPEPVETQEAEAEDTRSELQKAEEAEAKAFDALPASAKAAKLLDNLLERLRHQVKHNAPVGPALVQELEAIRDHLG
jgi:hypothetical protein